MLKLNNTNNYLINFIKRRILKNVKMLKKMLKIKK